MDRIGRQDPTVSVILLNKGQKTEGVITMLIKKLEEYII